MNFAATVARQARSNPDTTALLYQDQPLSYGTIDDRANAFANLLETAGIDDGDCIALFLPNVPEMVTSYLGCLKRGAVPIPVNQRYTEHEVAYILEDTTPRMLLTTPDLFENVPSLVDKNVEVIHVADGTTAGLSADGATVKSLPAALDGHSRDFRTVPSLNETVASIMYTSGSTGKPKPVVHQHGFHHAIAGGRLSFFDLNRTDVALVTSPLFHISGLGILDMALAEGSTVVLQRRWDPERFLTAVETHKVTYTHLITTVLIELVEEDIERANAYDTDSLRIVLTGGGSMTNKHLQQFERLIGGTVCEGYGRTEGGFAYNRPGERSPGTNGVPTYDINDLRIVDRATGERCDRGEAGEIQVRGEGVTVGYYERPDLNDEAFLPDGWMHTGDIGLLDEDGFLTFIDREDEIIKTGGEKVSPADVEAVLNEINGVAEAAVVGVQDERWGERVAAAIVKSDMTVDKNDIKQYCQDWLAGFKLPRTIVFVNSLPKQGSGKLDRNDIVTLVEERADEI